ncbi:hypothetical protein [Nocardiopsis flavescens]
MRSIVAGTATGGIGGWRHVVIGLAYVENVAGAQRRPVPGAGNATLAPAPVADTGAATPITEVRVPSPTTTASAAGEHFPSVRSTAAAPPPFHPTPIRVDHGGQR